MTTCLNCQSWSLKLSPLRAQGFGACNAMALPGRTFSPSNTCRFGKFTPANPAVIERRARELKKS